LTKIVTVTPRYIFKNKLSIDLQICEFGGTSNAKNDLKSQQTFPLYETSKYINYFCISVDDVVSCPFSIADLGQSFIKLKTDLLVKCTVSINEATLFVTFTKADEWPYRLVNDSNIQLELYQGVSKNCMSFL
jgi:vacuolar protein sorting-associated protein 13A/C